MGREDARVSTLVQFLALAVTWGASFLFIRISLEGLSPSQVVLGRLVSGAVALVVITIVTRQSLPREAVVWRHLAVVSVLLCVVPFLLFAWAGQHISSGLSSIYNATTPLMTMLVTLVALPRERPTLTRLAGLLAGLLGVLVVLAPWRGLAGGEALAQAGCLLATVSYGISFVYLRRFVSPRGLSAVPVATVLVGLGATVMLLAAPLVAAEPTKITARVTLSVLALGILGTGLAYVWNTNVVAAWGATNASTVTYLTPLVGIALGVLVLSERVRWNQPLGALVVVVGIVIGQERPARALRRLRRVGRTQAS